VNVHIILERFPYDPTVIPQLCALVASHRPDIIQTHNVKSHFLVRLTGMHRRACWIAFQHGYTRKDFKDSFYNQFDRWSLPAAHHVVTVCGAFVPALEKIGVSTERITVRHNTVSRFVPAPADEVNEIRHRLGIPPGTLVVLSAGRLSREKGHADLIEATAEIRSNLESPFLVLLAGEGPERAQIQNRAKELGVADIVMFLGHQPDVSPFYSMADVMVLPSHSEGSPNVLLEAMAAGLPTVATAVGGIPEIARRDETAFLVDKSDPHALADAICRLLRNEELREQFGATAKQIALQYDPEIYCKSILQLYSQLLIR
jgi:glycosyltransferase involved in cell wall biosynthesis